MKGELSIIVYNGMSGVCSALESHDDVGILCQHICDLTFPFISPVCSYNSGNHVHSSYRNAFICFNSSCLPRRQFIL